jgi:hypothetical protein
MSRKFTLGGFFSNFGASLMAELVSKPLGRAGGKAVELRLGKLLFDKRGELFEDLRRMRQVDTANLFRRHREAAITGRENRFVSLLLKIPPHGPLSGEETDCGYGIRGCQGCRREALRDLNHYSDEKFWHVLVLLEHDVVGQHADRVWRNVRETVRTKDRSVAGWLRAKHTLLLAKDAEWAARLQAGRERRQARRLQRAIERRARMWRLARVGLALLAVLSPLLVLGVLLERLE